MSQADEPRAGIILYDATKSRILLVQSRFTGKWGFTKGHAETWDIDPLETAMREVKEEAGYLEVIHYKITEGPVYLRNRPYWTAVLRSDETPTLNRAEQSGIGWFRLKEINRLKLNEDVKLYLASLLSNGI
jgi:8-oxo-dGTP pyrophosphatase MutT (NUDIX family)